MAELIKQAHGGSLRRGGPGRPKGTSVTQLIINCLYEHDGKRAKELAIALIEQAKKGNPQAIKQLLDRIDGPVTERIESSGVTKVIIERVSFTDSSPALGSDDDIEAEEAV